MFDATSPSEPPPALERAEGEVRLSFRRRGPASVVASHYERGSLKVRLPRAPDRPLAVLLNTAGGIAGGDRLAAAIALEPGAAATVTTQAAERVYRSTGATATVATTLSLAAGARLDWLPQETILFDRARLTRDLSVAMAADAELTLCESLVLGRQAMGESVRDLALIDRWRIRRGGRLVFADALRLGPPDAQRGPAGLGGARAVATILHLAPLAEGKLAPARAALSESAHPAGASAWDGMLLVRLLAPDGHTLRRALAAILPLLCDGRPLPRLWTL